MYPVRANGHSPLRCRGLVFGAEPADEAVAFFFSAFGVEGDKVFEDLLVGDVVGPTVGIDDGGI